MKREKSLMRIFSVLLLITMLFSGCSLGKKKTEVSEDEISQMNQSEDGKIHVDGKFSDITIKDSESAIRAAQEVAFELEFENAFDELEEISVNEVEGLTYYRLQQKYEGYPVYGDTVVVMANDKGEALGMTGNASDIAKTDMNKGVSEETVGENITKYVRDVLGYEYTEDITVEKLYENNLCVYNDGNKATLAYQLYIAFNGELYEFVVSAKEGIVLLENSMIRTNTVEAIGKNINDEKVKFNTWKISDSEYWLYDDERNLQVLCADDRTVMSALVIEYNHATYYMYLLDSDTYGFFDEKGNMILDLYLWNEIIRNGEPKDVRLFTNDITKELKPVSNASTCWTNSRAISMMDYITTTYDFWGQYNRKGFDNKNTKLQLVYDDNIGGSSNNAYSLTWMDGFSFLSFGTDIAYEIDIVAHEYMHSLEGSESGMYYRAESGAIMEGYSDIFGEIVEDFADNGKLDSSCNWANPFRDFKNPSETENPTIYKGEHWGETTELNEDHGYVHNNSTVITHVAYDMVGARENALTPKELSNLWYSTMFTLPSDCTFSTLRNNMEMVAKNIGLSQEKCEVVRNSFIAANIGGIENNDTPLEYSKEFKVAVYDVNTKLYGKYSIHIRGTETGFLRNKDYEETIFVNEENPSESNAIKRISLNYGVYTITVSENEGKSYSNEIVVVPRGLMEMNFATDFGEREVLVTDFEIGENVVTTVGELYAIEPEIQPLNATGYTIKWSSSDESVATVSPSGEAGIVQSLAKGTTTIKAELTTGKEVITKSIEVRVASKARDTVLVLDVSGSMYGAPIEEMKKSAIQFCEDLLKDEYNNRVGLVFYDHEINSIDLTNDLDYLVSEISKISDGGTTDMEGGLAEADTMLKDFGRDDSIKNVIVMADGLPNRGETSNSGSMPSGTYDGYATSVSYANAVIDTAKNMMQRYNLYSLGFFHDLYGEEKDFGTTLMQSLTNMTDGYYEVTEAEKLNFVFGDIQEEVSDGSKIVINIACPVDVNVTYEGETLSSASSTYNDKTSFGSLQLLGKNKDIKVVSLDADKKYNVKLQGTGEGTMNYSVNYYDEQETRTDYRSFTAVPITTETVITSSTDNVVEKVLLNIDEDGDGTVDVVWAAEHSSEAEVIQKKTEEPAKIEQPDEPKDNTVILVVVGVMLGVMMLGAIVVVLVMASGSKKPEEEFVPVAGEKKEETEKKETKEKEIERKIVILTGSMEGIEFGLPNDKICYVGRDRKQCQILLLNTYTSVSRLHCTIQFSEKDNLYYVTDCSSNGTFWGDGRRMRKGQRTAVQIGGKILIANAGCKIALM